MSYKQIIYRKIDRIAEIIINRPEKINAIGFPAVRELRAAFEEAEADDEVGVIILKGAGEKGFCSGDDTKCPEWLETGQNWTPEEMFRGLRHKHFYVLLEEIRKLWKPVIASVHGWCLGSAPELVLACDIIVASETAKFGVPLVTLGVTSTTAILPRVVGYHKACELLFTGDVIDANEAKAIGMVNHVVPHEQLDAKVGEIAAKLANQATPIIAMTKWALNKTMGDISEAIDYEVLACGLAHPSKYVPRLVERPERPLNQQE